MTNELITLVAADPDDFFDFKKELQDAFAVAVTDEFGLSLKEPIPSDEILASSMSEPNSVVLRILRDGQKVGGAVLTINKSNNHNSLDLFFLKVGEEGRGIGGKAWFAIERRYPDTITWQTLTPYFEKRNIHFYVNRCGFKIIEFFNKHHSDPHHSGQDELPDSDAFRFEKVMRSVGQDQP